MPTDSPRRGRRFLPAVLLALVSIFACRSAPEPGVVATTDFGDIRLTELEDFILSLPEIRRSPPDDTPAAEWRQGLLEDLITARALEAEARANKLGETPEGDALLTGQREGFLVQEMVSRLIAEKVEVTEEDLRSFYDQHPEEFSHPEQVRVRNIYRRVARDAAPEAWDAAEKEVEGFLEQIRQGARFGDIARTHSDSETASNEGLIGRLNREHVEPALAEILWSLDEGEVSEVIRTPVGFQIFMVENHLGTFKMDFEDARTRLTRRLTREATEAAEVSVLEDLLEESGATYEPELLASKDLEAVLFAHEGETLTLEEFHQYLDSIGFAAARDVPMLRLLQKVTREILCLWKAEQTGLASEPGMSARIEQAEKETLITLGRQERWRAMAAEMDEEDLRNFYAAQADRLQTPRLLVLRILTRDFPEEETGWYAVYEELEALAKEIRAGRRDFAEAAKELSSDYTALRGGDVGGIRAQAFAGWAGPEAQKKVLDLAAGEISEPLLIERYNSNRMTYDRAGYMLVKVEAIEEPRERPFEEVRDQVIDQFLEQSGQAILEQFRQQILSSVDAQIFAENL